MGKILITGATGQLGQLIVNKLLSQKVSPDLLYVLVRNEQKAEILNDKGVNIRIGNYNDINSLNKAMKGINRLMLISSSEFKDRYSQHKNVIEAATNANVEHIVYTSIGLKDFDNAPLKPFFEDHVKTESLIKKSGISYTILQNSLYAEMLPIFTGENVIETGINLPAGNGKIAFSNREDISEICSNILTENSHENKVYTISSHIAYSFDEIAKILSTISGKIVKYNNINIENYEAYLKNINLPDDIIKLSVLYMKSISEGHLDNSSNTLETLLRHKEIPMQTILKKLFRL